MSVAVLAGYWDLNLETGELLLCPKSRAMFGVEENSPRRLGKQDWIGRIHPDDVPVIEGELETAQRQRDIYTARFRAIRPDGSFCHILGVGRNTTKDPKRFMGLNFDVAETATSAVREARRPRGMMARLADLMSAGAGPANENMMWRRPARMAANPSWLGRDKEACRREMLLSRALATIDNRNARHRFFNPAMLGEPAFDMLLALYVTSASPAILSLGILSPAMGVSESTAARWLDLLVEEGLVLSVSGEGAPGTIHVALTDKGRVVLDEYFGAIH